MQLLLNGFWERVTPHTFIGPAREQGELVETGIAPASVCAGKQFCTLFLVHFLPLWHPFLIQNTEKNS